MRNFEGRQPGRAYAGGGCAGRHDACRGVPALERGVRGVAGLAESFPRGGGTGWWGLPGRRSERSERMSAWGGWASPATGYRTGTEIRRGESARQPPPRVALSGPAKRASKDASSSERERAWKPELANGMTQPRTPDPEHRGCPITSSYVCIRSFPQDRYSGRGEKPAHSKERRQGRQNKKWGVGECNITRCYRMPTNRSGSGVRGVEV